MPYHFENGLHVVSLRRFVGCLCFSLFGVLLPPLTWYPCNATASFVPCALLFCSWALARFYLDAKWGEKEMRNWGRTFVFWSSFCLCRSHPCAAGCRGCRWHSRCCSPVAAEAPFKAHFNIPPHSLQCQRKRRKTAATCCTSMWAPPSSRCSWSSCGPLCACIAGESRPISMKYPR